MLACSQSRSNNPISLKNVLTFAVGTVFGFCYAYLLIGAFRWKKASSFSSTESRADYSYARGVKNLQSHKEYVPIVYEVDRSVADELSRTVRVLCWVVTSPGNEKEAEIIKHTWGSRCNVLIFTSTKRNKHIPTITLNMTQETSPWSKTKKGFTYFYENYQDSVDWFLKVDHQNYIILENLRYMLQPYSPDDPVYFGRKFFRGSHQSYMSGAAGYVLSREALRRFVTLGLPVPSKCRLDDGGLEDLEMGLCLQSVGVVAGDSRDDAGRGRFFPFDPTTHIVTKSMEEINWYWSYTNISYPEEIDCCSDTTISFHYVFADLMYNYDYLLYGLNSRLIN